MPNRLPPWIDGAGNPTKSAVVNNLIREVRQFEVRGEGVSDQSMRAITEEEFRMTVDLFRAQEDWTSKWKYATMALWQYHLIGRIDDVVHFKTDDLKAHARFSFAMQTKVRWSKNVLEERRCPDQIILGAMDPVFCILANLGLYLESYWCNFPNSTYLLISHGTNTGPKNLIQTYRLKLEKVVLQSAAFQACSSGDSHGIGTATYAALGMNETQPVVKVPLYVYRIEDRLMIDEILQDNDETTGGNNTTGAIVNQQSAGIMSHQALLVKLDRMERQMNEQFGQVFAMMEASNRLATNHYHSMNSNIRQFGGTIEGAFVVQHGTGRGQQYADLVAHGRGQQEALLSQNPCTLMELWWEYKHGLDGRKPAEQFTMAERNS